MSTYDNEVLDELKDNLSGAVVDVADRRAIEIEATRPFHHTLRAMDSRLRRMTWKSKSWSDLQARKQASQER